MFEYAVDVVVVNRNTRVTKHNEFIERMFTAFARYGIQPSIVAIDMDANTRDLPRGRSIFLCIPEPEDLSYTRTHTSTYRKFSRHTPGEDNDCSAQSYLRVFDDRALYFPRLAEYLYPELVGRRREEEEALERSFERQGEEEGRDEEELPLERSFERQEEEVMDVGDDSGEAEEASTAGGSRQMAVPRRSERLRERERGTVPAGEAARGVVQPLEAFSMPQSWAFSYEEKNEVMTKINFLYEQARSMQVAQTTEAKSRAREAMLDYVSKKRCNFMTHDLDMLLNSGNFPNPNEYRTKRLLQQLTAEKYKYFKPLFPKE
ncbi:unnamed protein product [Cylicostephanus goldi]|uniref:Uncharacterized protein n=1 Tax=Cylicostephanus goldi TaxID=71465 RepID=A0A3P6QXB7_CYLGO|nr:unnamed protein product [Cylicostephanus goldi]